MALQAKARIQGLFRVDRVRDLRVLPEEFRVPAGFSMDSYMESAWGVERGDQRVVRIRFSSKAAPIIRETKWHPTQTLQDQPDGSLLVTVNTGGKNELARWVLQFGGEAEMLEPTDIREQVVRLAQGAAGANS